MNFPDGESVKKEGEITNEDYFDFICDYIIYDKVGIMSNAHLAWADQEGSSFINIDYLFYNCVIL